MSDSDSDVEFIGETRSPNAAVRPNGQTADLIPKLEPAAACAADASKRKRPTTPDVPEAAAAPVKWKWTKEGCEVNIKRRKANAQKRRLMRIRAEAEAKAKKFKTVQEVCEASKEMEDWQVRDAEVQREKEMRESAMKRQEYRAASRLEMKKNKEAKRAKAEAKAKAKADRAAERAAEKKREKEQHEKDADDAWAAGTKAGRRQLEARGWVCLDWLREVQGLSVQRTIQRNKHRLDDIVRGRESFYIGVTSDPRRRCREHRNRPGFERGVLYVLREFADHQGAGQGEIDVIAYVKRQPGSAGCENVNGGGESLQNERAPFYLYVVHAAGRVPVPGRAEDDVNVVDDSDDGSDSDSGEDAGGKQGKLGNIAAEPTAPGLESDDPF